MKRTPLRSRPKRRRSADERERMEQFRLSIRGLRCVACRRPERQAYLETGYGHQAHHAIRQQVLRDLGIDEWDPRLAVCVCEEPCHRQHTQRSKRIKRLMLPPAVYAFVVEHELERELMAEYPS